MARIALLLALLLPSVASATARDGAFNRVVMVVDTSCSMRQLFPFELDKLEESLPILMSHPEDELVVVALNGAPGTVWEGLARDLRDESGAIVPRHRQDILDGLRGAGRRSTDLGRTFQVLGTVLRRPGQGEPRFRHPPTAQAVLLFSDLIDEPPKGRPMLDVDADVPWALLKGQMLHLLGVDVGLEDTWREALERHGIAGDVVSAQRLPLWTPQPLERAEVEEVFENPEGAGQLFVGLTRLLVVGVAAVFGLVLLVLLAVGAFLAVDAMRRRRAPSPGRRGPRAVPRRARGRTSPPRRAEPGRARRR